MSWLKSSPIKKSQFYVWYLGSKESDALRGDESVLPVMRQLLKESFRRPPNKVTVQISGKGIKLIQTVPTVTKSGKLKMEVMKFNIPTNSITFSMTGPHPFHDVVAVILLVFNPEMKCPVHVHCYRCDTPETANIMNANIQILLSRPESQRHIVDLERRLFINGLLSPVRRKPITQLNHRPIAKDQHNKKELLTNEQEQQQHQQQHQQHQQQQKQQHIQPRPELPLRSTRPLIEHRSPQPFARRRTSPSVDRYQKHSARRNLSLDQMHSPPSDSQDYVGMSSDEDSAHDDPVTNLQRSLYNELKEKLKVKKQMRDSTEPMRYFGDYNIRGQRPLDICSGYPTDSDMLVGGLVNAQVQQTTKHQNMWDLRDGKHHRQQRTSAYTRHNTAADDGGNTSSTSGLGSDASTSAAYSKNSRSRTRNSIAEFPSWMIGKDEPEKSEPLAQSSPKPSKLRMFGDTIMHRKKKAPLFTSNYKQNNNNNNNNHYRSKVTNGIVHARPCRTKFRSMDNLHMAADSPVLPPGANYGSKKPSVFFPRSQMTDPFGQKLDRSANVDCFWADRAKRASSWYLDHDANEKLGK